MNVSSLVHTSDKIAIEILGEIQTDKSTLSFNKESSTKVFMPVELCRTHRHFGHPRHRKFIVIWNARCNMLHPALEKIFGRSCVLAQHAKNPPQSFSLSAYARPMQSDLTIKSYWILCAKCENSAVLERKATDVKNWDAGTRFKAAAFLSGESSIDVWNNFIRIWS